MADQPEQDNNPQPKEETVRIRASKTLMGKVRKKLKDRGGWSVSALTRALWEAWLEEEYVSPSDVAKSAESAPKGSKKRNVKK